MIENAFSDQHPLLRLSSDIQSCCGILNDIGITHFNHVALFNDQTEFSLCNRPEWVQYFYQEQLYKQGAYSVPQAIANNHVILWSSVQDQPVFQIATTKFHLRQGMTIVKQAKDATHFFYCGGSTLSEDQIVGRLPLLNRFIASYFERCKTAIQQATDSRIKLIMPKTTEDVCVDSLNVTMADVLTSQVKYYHYFLAGKKILLTKREDECALLLLKGAGPKAIAHQMNLSVRTVEKHLEKLKNKFQVRNLMELVIKLYQMIYQ